MNVETCCLVAMDPSCLYSKLTRVKNLVNRCKTDTQICPNMVSKDIFANMSNFFASAGADALTAYGTIVKSGILSKMYANSFIRTPTRHTLQYQYANMQYLPILEYLHAMCGELCGACHIPVWSCSSILD